MIEIKKASFENIENIIEIINDAKSFLKSQGLDQWQQGYPKESSIRNDIINNNSYILLDNGVIKATAAIIFDNDPNYSTIYNGKWLSSNNYVTIHRIATKADSRNKGYAKEIIEFAKNLIKSKNIESIRVDTHTKNIPMQKFLEKNGFKACGIIYLNNEINEVNKRIAYEYVIKKG